MTASTAANRDRGTDVEELACERWPLELADDAHCDWYDLEFIADLTTARPPVVVPAGTKAESKSCWIRYDGRAGRWWIERENHEDLVDADGEYVFSVVDGASGDVERMALVPATTVDALIDEWWDCGDGGRTAEEYRQIPWTAVFDDLDEPADGRGGDGA